MSGVTDMLPAAELIERASGDFALRGADLRRLVEETGDAEGFYKYVAAIEARCLELELVAGADHLTGLATRRRVEAAIESELSRSRRTGAPTSVLLIDVDHFKRVNDEQGHDAGDEVLRKLGELLSARCRRTDVVGRIGGEEFVAVLSETSEVDAARYAEALREEVSRMKSVAFNPVTVSVGVATAWRFEDARAPGWHTVSREVILRRADSAMYAAKEAGRDRVVGWTADAMEEL